MNHELFFFFFFFSLHAVNIEDRIEDARLDRRTIISFPLPGKSETREGRRERERERKNCDACSRGRQGGEEIAESARMQIRAAVTGAAFSSMLPATCNVQPESLAFLVLPACLYTHASSCIMRHSHRSNSSPTPSPSLLRPPFLRHTLPSLLLRRLLLPPLASPPRSLGLSLLPRDGLSFRKDARIALSRAAFNSRR